MTLALTIIQLLTCLFLIVVVLLTLVLNLLHAAGY